MKQILLISIVISVTIIAVAIASEEKKYTTKYDNIDLDELVKNERLLKSYVDCLLDKGPCTPDGLELKRNMPDAIATNCSKCSEKQKEGSDFIMKFLIDNKPEYWTKLEDKYDPSGSYKKQYLESKNNDDVDIEPVTPSN
nr:chemosensory protein 3 [Lytta caraganae]